METLLIALRAVHTAATLSLVGAAVSSALVTPAATRSADIAARDRVRRHQLWLAAGSLAVALVAALAFLVVQSAELVGSSVPAEIADAVPLVLTGTVFGHAWIARVVLLVLVAATWRLPRIVALIALAAVVPQAWMGHAGASGTVILPVSLSLHVMLVAAWLGGLAPLALLIRDLPGCGARDATLRFAAIGWVYVIGLPATAIAQGWLMIGSASRLFGTAYGQVALFKAVLLAALLALAALNRYRLARRVSSAPGAFLGGIAVELAVALMAIAAAALLSQLPPADAP